MKKLLLGLLICSLPFAAIKPGHSQRNGPVNPIDYGHISFAEIADFGSYRLNAPCDALTKHQFTLASNGFRAILSKDEKINRSDRLAAYIGLVQADRLIWPIEIKKLQSRIKTNDPMAQFKLGVILYYKWGQQRTAQDTTLLAKSQSLINSAWVKCKLPIVGMMEDEVISRSRTSYTDSHPGLNLNVDTQLIKQLAGSKAYLAYLKSANGDQAALPSSADLVPVNNLRPLRGVVRDRIAISQIQVSTCVLQGNNVIATPVPLSEDQKREYQFMTAWSDLLSKRIDALHL